MADKIKCASCWYYHFIPARNLQAKPTAYCRMLDCKIAPDKEKTRCKHYTEK